MISNLERNLWGLNDEQRSAIEDTIEAEQIESDGVLRCCLSLKCPKSDHLSHLMIFEHIPGSSKLYTVQNFAVQLADYNEKNNNSGKAGMNRTKKVKSAALTESGRAAQHVICQIERNS